jgi:hypothetical protein
MTEITDISQMRPGKEYYLYHKSAEVLPGIRQTIAVKFIGTTPGGSSKVKIIATGQEMILKDDVMDKFDISEIQYVPFSGPPMGWDGKERYSRGGSKKRAYGGRKLKSRCKKSSKRRCRKSSRRRKY